MKKDVLVPKIAYVKNKANILYLLLFLINFIISFSWFKPNNFIAFGDATLRIPYYSTIVKDAYLWYEGINFPGGEHYFGLHYLFFDIFYEFLRRIGTEPWLMQAILDSMLFGISSVSMLYLLNKLFGNRWINLIGAMLYLYNPYIATNLNIFINTQPFWGLTYALTPVVVALFIEALSKNDLWSKLKFSLCSIFLLGIFGMGTLFVAIILFLGLYLFFLLLMSKNKTSILINFTKTLAIFLLLNVWWLYPITYLILSAHSQNIIKAVYSGPGGTWTYATILNAMRLCDVFLIYVDPKYYSYDVTIFARNPLFIVSTVLFPIVSFMSLLFIRRERIEVTKRNIVIFNLILLILIFLEKDGNAPLGGLNKTLSRFPIFSVFVEPRLGFLIMLMYSILITYTLLKFLERTRISLNKRHILLKLSVLSLLLLLFLPALPIATGGLVPTKYWTPEKAYVPSIPRYVLESEELIDKDKTINRALPIPFHVAPRITCFGYEWGYYGGPSFIETIFRKEFIPFHVGSWFHTGMSDVLPYIYKNMNNNKESFIKLLQLLNVKYVIWQGDVNSVEQLNHTLSFLNSCELDKHILDKWIIFEINNTLPRIYPVTRSVLVNGSFNNMLEIFSLGNYQVKVNNTIILLSTNISKKQLHVIGKYIDFQFFTKNTILRIENGNRYPFSWDKLSNNSIEARYYIGWKSVIRTDGKEQKDTLSFQSSESCPYIFPPYSPSGWSALNSTLIYIKTGSKPLVINRILENNKPVNDIAGVWWETGWMGMGTKPVKFPIIIPQNQRAIIQILHMVHGNITMNMLTNLGKLTEINQQHVPKLTFKKVNPTKYIISVENATKPFFLVFSESYHPRWKLYVEDRPANFTKIIEKYPNINVEEAEHEWYKFTPGDIIYLFRKPSLNETYHFKANGYANAWYINPQKFDKDGDGRLTITIYFLPQSLFYLGLIISSITFIVCIGYLLYDWVMRKKPLDWYIFTKEKVGMLLGSQKSKSS